jgi:hypothetical protein
MGEQDLTGLILNSDIIAKTQGIENISLIDGIKFQAWLCVLVRSSGMKLSFGMFFNALNI